LEVILAFPVELWRNEWHQWNRRIEQV